MLPPTCPDTPISSTIPSPSSDSVFSCFLCAKRFGSPAGLSRHQRTHTGERPFVCDLCPKAFSVRENLHVHRRAVHTKERPFRCEFCPKAFEHSGKLRRHVRTHTGEKPHECDLCGKAFVQSGQLSIHRRSHTGEKPYQCTVCDKRFACNKQLSVHLRTHSGEKPYSCNVCGKSFGYNHVLKLHQVSHFGEKVYKCTLCQETFSSKKALELHIRIHTGAAIGNFSNNSRSRSTIHPNQNLPTLKDCNIERLDISPSSKAQPASSSGIQMPKQSKQCQRVPYCEDDKSIMYRNGSLPTIRGSPGSSSSYAQSLIISDAFSQNRYSQAIKSEQSTHHMEMSCYGNMKASASHCDNVAMDNNYDDIMAFTTSLEQTMTYDDDNVRNPGHSQNQPVTHNQNDEDLLYLPSILFQTPANKPEKSKQSTFQIPITSGAHRHAMAHNTEFKASSPGTDSSLPTIIHSFSLSNTTEINDSSLDSPVIHFSDDLRHQQQTTSGRIYTSSSLIAENQLLQLPPLKLMRPAAATRCTHPILPGMSSSISIDSGFSGGSLFDVDFDSDSDKRSADESPERLLRTQSICSKHAPKQLGPITKSDLGPQVPEESPTQLLRQFRPFSKRKLPPAFELRPKTVASANDSSLRTLLQAPAHIFDRRVENSDLDYRGQTREERGRALFDDGGRNKTGPHAAEERQGRISLVFLKQRQYNNYCHADTEGSATPTVPQRDFLPLDCNCQSSRLHFQCQDNRLQFGCQSEDAEVQPRFQSSRLQRQDIEKRQDIPIKIEIEDDDDDDVVILETHEAEDQSYLPLRKRKYDEKVPYANLRLSYAVQL